MIIKKLNKENAIILCGHGSRDSDYKNEMLGLKIKLEVNCIYFSNIITNFSKHDPRNLAIGQCIENV